MLLLLLLVPMFQVTLALELGSESGNHVFPFGLQISVSIYVFECVCIMYVHSLTHARPTPGMDIGGAGYIRAGNYY